LRQLVPFGGLTQLDPGEIYDGIDLSPGPGDRPYVVLNMVTTVDGKVALNGSAGGIGSRNDRALMRMIRSKVDAVMIGAATLRAEICDPRVEPRLVKRRVQRGWTPQPLAVGVSGSLDLEPTNRFLVNGPQRTVLLTTMAAPRERRQRLGKYAAIQVQGEHHVDLVSGLRLLHQAYGVRRLLCEGGPSLNQQLLDAGLIDELFCTIAPKLAGGQSKGVIDGPAPAERITARMEMVSLFEDGGELFARYRLPRGDDGGYLS
jgi:riboflavin-specific deaminase-like protein